MNISQPVDNSLLNQAVQQVGSIAEFYDGHLFAENRLALSKNRVEQSESNVQVTLTIDGCYDILLPSDWIYLPIIFLFEKYFNGECGNVSSSSSSIIQMVVRPLEAIYIISSLHPDWFFRVEPAHHFCRLACIFLAGNDLFLDADISAYLWPILRATCSAERALNLSKSIQGVEDFSTL